MSVIYDTSKGNDLAMIINYDCNHSFIALATVIMIVNYDRKTFIAQATDLQFQQKQLEFAILLGIFIF
jgi:hypothetical protein